MTASYIEEKDASDVTKKVLTELLDIDKHAPSGVIYADGTIVSTDDPLPVGGTLLTSLETKLAAIQTAASSIQSSATAIAASAATLAGAVSGTEVQADIVSGQATITGSVALGPPTGATRTQKQLRRTTSTTSTDLWTPASGKLIAVHALLVTWAGANACRLTIWQGANADVTLSDTEPFLFDITLDAAANGGVALTFPAGYPWLADTVDHELHLTLSADKTVFILAVGDER